MVELAGPRATSSADASLELGCVGFLHLTFVPKDLPPDLYEFRLAANGREARCEFMVPFKCRRAWKECYTRDTPTYKRPCPDPCKGECVADPRETDPVVCTGDLKVEVSSRDFCEFEPTFELGEIAESVEFTVLRAGSVVRRDVVRPTFRSFTPNGTAGPPVCRQGLVDIGGVANAPSERPLGRHPVPPSWEVPSAAPSGSPTSAPVAKP